VENSVSPIPAGIAMESSTTAKQRRSEMLQLVLSVLTLVLVITECAIHHHLLGSI
jgi:hypothetical protein